RRVGPSFTGFRRPDPGVELARGHVPRYRSARLFSTPESDHAFRRTPAADVILRVLDPGLAHDPAHRSCLRAPAAARPGERCRSTRRATCWRFPTTGRHAPG